MRSLPFLLALIFCSIVQAETNLLVNGDFESGPRGWSFALWPRPEETPVGRAMSVSDAKAKSGQHSLRIDTGAASDRQKELVFNAEVRDDARNLGGKRLDLDGWIYVEPKTAVRPISMTLRVWGKNDDPGKGGLLGTPISIHVAGTPGKWTEFQASGIVPEGQITQMDLHCGIRPDVASTVLYLDDLHLSEHLPAPLEITAYNQPLWRDATAGIDVRLNSPPPPNASLHVELHDQANHAVARWDRPLPVGTRHGGIGLDLPRPLLPEGLYHLHAELRDRNKTLETATAEIELLESPWEAYKSQGLARGTIDGKRAAAFSNAGTVAPDMVEDVLPSEAEPQPATMPSADEQPLVVFTRNAFDPISRLSRPRPGEWDEARVFACPGQYVPVQIGIWARKSVRQLAFGTQMVVGGRLQVSSDLIDVRAVRLPKNLPAFLEKRESIEVPEGQTQPYWVTLYIPPGTKPGFYSVSLQAQADHGKMVDFPILIRVLPLELPVTKKGYGFWWAMDSRWNSYYTKPHDVVMEQIRKQFILLREHGCNVVSLYSIPKISRSADGNFSFDFTRDQLGDFAYSFNDIVQLGLETKFLTTSQPIQYPGADELRQYGAEELKMKRGSPEFDDLYQQACRAIHQWAKSKGITLAFACVDEIGNSVERQQEALRYYPLAQKAGALTSVTDNSMWGGQYLTGQPRFDRVIDMRVFNFILPEMVQTTRQSGDRLWLYNLGDLTLTPRRERFVFGLFTDRCGADGYLQWAFQWPHQNKSPYESAAAGRFEPYNYVLPAPDGPLPTIGFEAVREGIVDARYLELARQAGLPDSRFLAKDLTQDSTAIGSFLDRHGDNFNDAVRWKVARAVLAEHR